MNRIFINNLNHIREKMMEDQKHLDSIFGSENSGRIFAQFADQLGTIIIDNAVRKLDPKEVGLRILKVMIQMEEITDSFAIKFNFEWYDWHMNSLTEFLYDYLKIDSKSWPFGCDSKELKDHAPESALKILLGN